MVLTEEQQEKIREQFKKDGPYRGTEELGFETEDKLVEEVAWLISLILRLNRDFEDLAKRVEALEGVE